jgi:UDP-glucose 4-epimerase
VRAHQQPPPSRVAVTGATGFLGLRLVKALVALDTRVVALVRNPDEAARSQGLLNESKVELAQFDLRRELDSSVLSDVDTLVHAAAHIPAQFADPSEAAACLDENALGTLRLMQTAARAGVPHVIYVSAGNAYADDGTAAKETDPLYPSSTAPYYLVSKVVGEVYTDHLHRDGAYELAVLRPSGIYGPGMRNGGLVSTLIAQALAGRPLIVRDGGRYHVDLVHVDDVVDVVMACIAARSVGVYNVGSGHSSSSIELASNIIEIAGLPRSQLTITGPLDGPRLGFPALDITRAREKLNYSPRTLREGLVSLVQGDST